MSDRAQRLVLLLVAAILLVSVIGHGTSFKQMPVAFVRSSFEEVLVRVSGDLREGIYKIPDGTTVAAAIKMAVPKVPFSSADMPVLSRKISAGEIILAEWNDSKHMEIKVVRMGARERMLLGLPLLPNEMTRQEWEELPSIGPALARAIMNHRQCNGDFQGVADLVRVPGIGHGTLGVIMEKF